MKMKLCVAGFLFIISSIFINIEAVTPVEKAVIKSKIFAVAIECIQSNPLTLAEMKAFKYKAVPEGQNPKCFTACLYKKIGIMDDMGMLSPAGARKNAEIVFKGNEEQLKNVDELMQSCSYVNEQKTDDGSKGCDRAKLAFKCLLENGQKYGFDFV